MKEVKVLVQTRYKNIPVRPGDPSFTVDDKVAERWGKRGICEVVGEADVDVNPADPTGKKYEAEQAEKNEKMRLEYQIKYGAPQKEKKVVNAEELEILKKEADELDISYPHNISADTLRQKIADKVEEINNSTQAE